MIVVTPTYNERDNVVRHVRAVLSQPGDLAVLIVDDSSPDGTGRLVAGLVQEFPDRVALLSRATKDGLGPAYVAAFRAVLAQGRHDVIVQMDVDGSHDPADVGRLLAAVAAGAGLAVGSRYCAGGRIEDWSRSRRAISRAGNGYAQGLLGGGVRDLTSGFKAWRSPTLQAVLSELDQVPSGYAFQIATTMAALGHGATVVEVPITFRDRSLGQSKMSKGIAAEAMVAVLQLRAARLRSRWSSRSLTGAEQPPRP